MSLNAIAVSEATGKSAGMMTVPPEYVEEGSPSQEVFVSSEFPAEGKFEAGIWVGTPGKLKIEGYPSDEVFTVIEGRIDMINEDGSVVVVKVGESGLMRKGWKGIFHVVEPTKKCFAAVG